MNSDYHEYQERVRTLEFDFKKLEFRLAEVELKLRANEPPEAKFKVGQVLMLSVGCAGMENAFSVKHIWYDADTKQWLYSNHRIRPNNFPNYWSSEVALRALTAAEKGENL